ncbi:MAG TPA: dihydrolipoamide acetyltransferase family protein, partial [Blastocatellia bacterium]|nr:dihydrolipoamide acetyltransferase family protein [Blastocatellia bacterium]
MSEEVKMPQMGESIAEGTIVKWLKQVGDAVKRDEPLFEISTDKVDAEIPSPSSGVLSQIMVKEGETVAVNTIVAVINGGAAAPAEASKPAPKEEPKKAPEPAAAKEAAPGAPQPEPKAAAPAPPPAPAAPPAQASAAAPPSKDDTRGTRSSPVVRKIAEEHGVDISQIEGTGIGGRVTKQDILSFVENRAAGAKAEPAAAAAPEATPAAAAPQRPTQPLRAPAPDQGQAEALPQPFADGDRVEIEPMTVMRRRIAERMVESRHISAHVTSFMEVDFTKTAKLRESMKVEFERDGVKLTFMPFIIKAVIEAIKKWPLLNSSVWGDQIVFKKDINIGVAVALDWGLIVPVIRGADEKSLLGLARSVNDLGDRARRKQLKPDEVQGGTFTITNPGSFGGWAGTPIINQPQVAILGVGVIKKRPVVINDAIAI